MFTAQSLTFEAMLPEVCCVMLLSELTEFVSEIAYKQWINNAPLSKFLSIFFPK